MSCFHWEIIYMVLHRLFKTVDEILWKKSIHFTPFSKEICYIYFEHNRNSIESKIHELKNIKSFSPLEHGPKSVKSALEFLILCFHLCQTCQRNFL